MTAPLRTPNLTRAVADYVRVFGFTCRQHIPGVLALLHHGPLQLQLWACAAPPGRFERTRVADLPAAVFAPSQHSVVVTHIHALHASLGAAVQRAGADPSVRLPGEGPQLQPWGAWEFAFSDGDGHLIHCVDWGAWWPAPSCQGGSTLSSDTLADDAEDAA